MSISTTEQRVAQIEQATIELAECIKELTRIMNLEKLPEYIESRLIHVYRKASDAKNRIG